MCLVIRLRVECVLQSLDIWSWGCSSFAKLRTHKTFTLQIQTWTRLLYLTRIVNYISLLHRSKDPEWRECKCNVILWELCILQISHHPSCRFLVQWVDVDTIELYSVQSHLTIITTTLQNAAFSQYLMVPEPAFSLLCVGMWCGYCSTIACILYLCISSKIIKYCCRIFTSGLFTGLQHFHLSYPHFNWQVTSHKSPVCVVGGWRRGDWRSGGYPGCQTKWLFLTSGKLRGARRRNINIRRHSIWSRKLFNLDIDIHSIWRKCKLVTWTCWKCLYYILEIFTL